jgi:hypothetical protein
MIRKGAIVGKSDKICASGTSASTRAAITGFGVCAAISATVLWAPLETSCRGAMYQCTCFRFH